MRRHSSRTECTAKRWVVKLSLGSGEGLLVELVGGAAGVFQAQLGVQVMQLLVTTEKEAAHLGLCRLSCLQSI